MGLIVYMSICFILIIGCGAIFLYQVLAFYIEVRTARRESLLADIPTVVVFNLMVSFITNSEVHALSRPELIACSYCVGELLGRLDSDDVSSTG